MQLSIQKFLTLEVNRFIITGCCAVLTDYFTYTVLTSIISTAPAKALSFIAGTIVAYLLNKYWTFQQKKKSTSEVGRFAFLYSSTLGANVLVNAFVLTLFPASYVFAFLSATGTSTILNYLGQKYWVFKAI